MEFGWRSRPGVKDGAPKLTSKSYATRSGASTKQVPSQCKSARPPDMPKHRLLHRVEDRLELFFRCKIMCWKIEWRCKDYWSWQGATKSSQAKTARQNKVRSEVLIVSRAQDPEAWGRVCRIGTVFPVHSQSSQMIHVSCPLETKEQELTRFFWKIKWRSFEWDKVSLVCIPETWGRVSWIEIHPFDVLWNISHKR